MIVIAQSSIIYVVAPANVATGGPELLHQLAFKLRKRNLDARMYYLGDWDNCPVHDNYREYNIPWCTTVEDQHINVLITPETMTDIIENFENLRKVIWWQSVDNHFFTLPRKKSMINSWLLNYLKTQNYLFLKQNVRRADFHLAQSAYALNFLKKRKFHNVRLLGDYLHAEFLSTNALPSNKEDIVLFNPRKGRKFTQRLIDMNPDITFVPLQNLSRSEAMLLMRRAKLYIDFGFHPGKDRMPREAAHLNCCVLVGRLGSAANHYDVPIPREYKFKVKRGSAHEISKTIKDILRNYDTKVYDFNEYRDTILQEEERFEQDCRQVFVSKDKELVSSQVSVCIPTFNSFEKFERCITSVMQQKDCQFEVVVGDDSTDIEQARLIESHCVKLGVRYFHHSPALGVPGNWNFLIAKAKAPLVQILHHDDRYSQKYSLKKFIAAMDANPICSMGVASSMLHDGETYVDNTTVSCALLERINKSPSLLYAKNQLGAPSATVFRAENIRRYRRGYKYVTDLVFYYDNIRIGPLLAIPEKLVKVDISKEGRLTSQNESNSALMITEFWHMMWIFKFEHFHFRTFFRFISLSARIIVKRASVFLRSLLNNTLGCMLNQRTK